MRLALQRLWPLLLALLSACAVAPRDRAAEPPALTAVDAIVADAMSSQRIPGVAVGVLQQGRVLLARGYGIAHVEHAVPVTPATVFQSGSLAKQFAAVAVMQQVEAGRLTLDDAVRRFLPALPPSWEAITVRQLLNHSAGLPDHPPGRLDLRRDYSEADLLELAAALPLSAPAGARWQYVDTGYQLIGVLLRALSGRFYGDLLAEQVFAPSGMHSARVISEEAIVMHRAAGYRLEGTQLRNQHWVAPSLNTTADGSLYLSLDDWLRWAQVLQRRGLLQAASWEAVFRPAALTDGSSHPYGLGWELGGPGQPAGYRHAGAWQGFSTAYLHRDTGALTVIVLCNLGSADAMAIAERVAAHIGAQAVGR